MADLIAIAETLEAQAAALRREAARQAQEGQAELALLAPGSWAKWSGEAENPPVEPDCVVEIELRDGSKREGPAGAFDWCHDRYAGTSDAEANAALEIVAYRVAAEQPAT